MTKDKYRRISSKVQIRHRVLPIKTNEETKKISENIKEELQNNSANVAASDMKPIAQTKNIEKTRKMGNIGNITSAPPKKNTKKKWTIAIGALLIVAAVGFIVFGGIIGDHENDVLEAGTGKIAAIMAIKEEVRIALDTRQEARRGEKDVILEIKTNDIWAMFGDKEEARMAYNVGEPAYNDREVIRVAARETAPVRIVQPQPPPPPQPPPVVIVNEPGVTINEGNGEVMPPDLPIIVAVHEDRSTAITIEGNPLPEGAYEIRGNSPDDTGDIFVTFPSGTDEHNIETNLPGDNWNYIIEVNEASGEVIVTITPPGPPIIIAVHEDRSTVITIDGNPLPEGAYEIRGNSPYDTGDILVTFPSGTDGHNIETNLPGDGWNYIIEVDEASGEVVVTITPPGPTIIIVVNEDRSTVITIEGNLLPEGAYEIRGNSPYDEGDILVTFPSGVGEHNIVINLPGDDWNYTIEANGEVVITIMTPGPPTIIDVYEDRSTVITIEGNPLPEGAYEIKGNSPYDIGDILVTFPSGTDGYNIEVNLPGGDDWNYAIEANDEVTVTITTPSSPLTVTDVGEHFTTIDTCENYDIESSNSEYSSL